MKCDSCNENTATVHLTEICDGQKVEKHLCKECAMKEGIAVKSQVSLDKMFNDLVVAHKHVDQLNDIACPECGMKWAEFRQSGLLGCPNDYKIFGDALEQVIARSHEGATDHVSSQKPDLPEDGDNQVKCLKLRQELQEAVKTEDFERAARLRDEIDSLSSALIAHKHNNDIEKQ